MRWVTRRIHGEEEGVTVVIVALSLIAMFGMLVLVIDVGGLLWKRRELVNGADAAALAAAQTCSVPLTQDSSLPEDQADRGAVANVPGLTAGEGGIVAGGSTCRQPRGFVSVRYSQDKALFFAPVLGFGDTNPVIGEATAAWGALGGGKAVPIVLESSQFQGPCDIPNNVNIGDNCNFWYNNGNFDNIGGAQWGFLNLDEWDVALDYNCNSAGGAANRSDYILNNFGTNLNLRDPVTYVCSMSGHASANWQDLVDRMNCDPNSATPSYANCPGNILLMPVNDCDEQVDKSGNIVPCGAGTPDKFAIIGFTSLELSGVYRGNDPAAIGTPGIAAQSDDCGTNGTGLVNNALGQWNLGSLADTACGGPDYLSAVSRYHVPYASVRVTRKVGPTTTTFVKCPPTGGVGCDYLYNEDNTNTVNGVPPLTLKWVNSFTQTLNNKVIEMDWSVDGTAGVPGYCGIQQSDPNAICLVTTWRGYTTYNSIIGNGPDEGTKAFILCDFKYDSCPAGVNP